MWLKFHGKGNAKDKKIKRNTCHHLKGNTLYIRYIK